MACSGTFFASVTVSIAASGNNAQPPIAGSPPYVPVPPGGATGVRVTFSGAGAGGVQMRLMGYDNATTANFLGYGTTHTLAGDSGTIDLPFSETPASSTVYRVNVINPSSSAAISALVFCADWLPLASPPDTPTVSTYVATVAEGSFRTLQISHAASRRQVNARLRPVPSGRSGGQTQWETDAQTEFIRALDAAHASGAPNAAHILFNAR
jgi:hypothetical protein